MCILCIVRNCDCLCVCVYVCVYAAVVKNLTDVFYLCVIMMAYGPVLVKATVYGIILNTVQSLASLPEVMANGT